MYISYIGWLLVDWSIDYSGRLLLCTNLLYMFRAKVAILGTKSISLLRLIRRNCLAIHLYLGIAVSTWLEYTPQGSDAQPYGA